MIDVVPDAAQAACACACGCRASSACSASRRRAAQARRILDRARAAACAIAGDDLEVEVPSFRRDLAMEDDLVEEIIRVWGYDRIPSTLLPGGDGRGRARVRSACARRASCARRWSAPGSSRRWPTAFSDPARAAALRRPATPSRCALLNPLSAGRLAAARSIRSTACSASSATNVRRQQPNVRVFEIGRTYERARGGDTGTMEPRWAAIALTGARQRAGLARRRPSPWTSTTPRGYAEHVLATFGVAGADARGRAARRLRARQPRQRW